MSHNTTVQKTDHIGTTRSYTPVTVKDKDSNTEIVINFSNCKIEGNEATWTIKDGQVVDKYGKTIANRTIEVTRYQAALIQAAAEGNEKGDLYLDERDLIGGNYAINAEKALQNAKSEYKLSKDSTNYEGLEPTLRPIADAYEHGEIYAAVENSKGEKGKITITLTPQGNNNVDIDNDKPWRKFGQLFR